MDKAETLGVTIVAGIDAAATFGFLPVELDRTDPSAERPVGVDRGRIAVTNNKRRMRRRRPQAIGKVGGHRRAAPRPPAIDDQPLAAVGQLERQCRRAAPAPDPAGGRGGRVSDHDGRAARHPLVTPVTRLAERTGAHTAGGDNLLDVVGRHRSRSLPARQRTIAQRDTVQRGDRAQLEGGDKLGHRLASRVIHLREHRQQNDSIGLIDRRPTDHAAIVAEPAQDCALQPRFTECPPRIPARHEQTCRDNPGPCRQPRIALCCAVRTSVEMPRAAGQSVQHRGSVYQIGR